MKLIKAGIDVQHLQNCAQFFVGRGNLDQDPDAVIALNKAGVNAELPIVLDLITSRGNRPQDYNLIIEFSKAGVKHADLKTTLEFLANNNYSAPVLELIRALFKAQPIVSTEISQQTKAELLVLLNSYIQAGCTAPEAAAMLDLLTGKSKNKHM